MQKVVFEVIQVPGDGLAVKTGIGIADGVVQVAARFDLEAREDGDNFAVGLDHGGSDVFAGAVLGEKFEERGVAEIFFKVGALVESFALEGAR